MTELTAQIRGSDVEAQKKAIRKLGAFGPVMLEKAVKESYQEVFNVVTKLLKEMDNKQFCDERVAVVKIARQLLMGKKYPSPHASSYLQQETDSMKSMLLKLITNSNAYCYKQDSAIIAFIRENVKLPLAVAKSEILESIENSISLQAEPAEKKQQTQADIPVFDLDSIEIPREVIRKIPACMANIYRVIPVSFESEILTIATSSIDTSEILQDLQLMLHCEVKAVKANDDQIERAVEKYYYEEMQGNISLLLSEEDSPKKALVYDLSDSQAATDGKKEAKDLKPAERVEQKTPSMITSQQRKVTAPRERAKKAKIEKEELPPLKEIMIPSPKEKTRHFEIEDAAESAPVKKLLNLILMQVAEDNASELYLEPSEDGLNILERVKGNLVEMMPPPPDFASALIYRIKKLSSLEPTKTKIPQDGVAEIEISGKKTLVHVSTTPTMFGESFTIRIMEPKEQPVAKIREIPLFERALSEEAGRPGPLERFVGQCVWLMKVIQATIGLKFILIANALDILIETFVGYVKGIFEIWKTGKTIQKRLSRRLPQDQIAGISEDLAISRFSLSRLFSFPGFCLEDWYHRLPSSQEWTKRTEPTFALKIVLETRCHLDEMKRDLSLLTMRQIQQFTKKSFVSLLLGFIPNLWELLLLWKDWFILVFMMEYSRNDVEQMYADFLLCYQKILASLQKQYYGETQADLAAYQTLAYYEQDMISRLGKAQNTNSSNLEEEIDETKFKVQRLIQMLCKPKKILTPCTWNRFDLLWEVQKSIASGKPYPFYILELDRWLINQVEKALMKKGMLCNLQERELRWQEAKEFRKRYQLARQLNAQFL